MAMDTKATFTGQVRTVGMTNTIQWKTGSICFDADPDCKQWMAKLYLAANPKRVLHQMNINSSEMSVKCSRLIIENKKGNGIQVKLTSGRDTEDARELIRKIRDRVSESPKNSKAEAMRRPNGFISMQSLKESGSENVSPWNKSHSNVFITSPGQANFVRSQNSSSGSLTKKRPPDPPSPRPQHSSLKLKRRLELLPSPDSKMSVRGRGNTYADANMASHSAHQFTSMKDSSLRYTKSNPGLHSLSAKNFYGSKTPSPFLLDKSNRGSNISRDTSNRSVKIQASPLTAKPTLSQRAKWLTGESLRSHSMAVNMEPPPIDENDNINEGEDGSAAADECPVDICSGSDDGVVSLKLPAMDENWSYGQSSTVGFENLGNSCFMNSPLQCLSSLEPFSLDVQSAMVLDGRYFQPDSVTRMLYLLMKDIRRSNASPSRVTDILIRLRNGINGKFEINTQQDAHELLTELLNRTHEEVKAVMKKKGEQQDGGEGTSGQASGGQSSFPPKSEQTSSSSTASGSTASGSTSSGSSTESASSAAAVSNSCSAQDQPSPVDTNFKWFYQESWQCKVCGTRTPYRESDDTILILPISSKTDHNVQDCVDKYFGSSELERECATCGKTEAAVSTRQIVQRPRIFILMLLRYQHLENRQSQKMMDSIGIPRYISIQDFCAEDVKPPPYIQPVFMLDREAEDLPCVPDSPQSDENDAAAQSKKWIKISVDQTINKVAEDSEDCARTKLSPSAGAKANRELSKYELILESPNIRSSEVYKQSLTDLLSGLENMDQMYKASFFPDRVERLQTIHAFTNYIAKSLLTYYNDVCSIMTSEHMDAVDSPDCRVPDWKISPKLKNLADGLASCFSPENARSMCLMIMVDLIKFDIPKTNLMGNIVLKALVEDIHTTRYSHRSRRDTWLVKMVIELSLVLAISKTFDQWRNIERFLLERNATDHSYSAETTDEVPDIAHVSPCDLKVDDDDDADAGVQEVLNSQFLGEFKVKKDMETIALSDYLQGLKRKPSMEGPDGTSTPEEEAGNYDCMDPLYLGKSMDSYTETELRSIDVESLLEEAQMAYAIAVSKFETHMQSEDPWLSTYTGIAEGESTAVDSSLENNKGDEEVDMEVCESYGFEKIVVPGAEGNGEQKSVEDILESMECLSELSVDSHSRGSEVEKEFIDSTPSPQSSTCSVDMSSKKVKYIRSKDQVSEKTEVTLESESSESQRSGESVEIGSLTDGGSGSCSQKPEAPSHKNSSTCGDYESEQINSISQKLKCKDCGVSMRGYTKCFHCGGALSESVSAPSRSSEAVDSYVRPNVMPSIIGSVLKDQANIVIGGEKITLNISQTAQDLGSKSVRVRRKLPELPDDADSGETSAHHPDKSLSLSLAQGEELTPPKPDKKLSPSVLKEKRSPGTATGNSPNQSNEKVCVSLSNGRTFVCSVDKVSPDDESKRLLRTKNSSSLSGDSAIEKCSPGSLDPKLSPGGSAFDGAHVVPNKELSPICRPSKDSENDVSLIIPSLQDSKVDSARDRERRGSQERLELPDLVLSSGANSPAGKKDQHSASLLKTSNFVKTKDYSRLRSPNKSPRKKAKGHPTPHSAKKMLPELFRTSPRSTPLTSEASDNDLDSAPRGTPSTSESISGLSVEVNVDDMSFMGRRQDDTFSPHPAAATSGSNPSPPVSSNSPSPPISSSLPFPGGAGAAGSSEEMLLTSTPQPGSTSSLLPPSGDPSKVYSVLTVETTHENVMPEKQGFQPASSHKSKATRSLAGAFGSPEEKENKSSQESIARTKRQEFIESGKAPCSYRLTGVVNHLGDSPNLGHYISYCYNLHKGRWFHLDDKHTSEMDEREARTRSLNTGYVFFYMDKELFDQYESKAPLDPTARHPPRKLFEAPEEREPSKSTVRKSRG
ncbi:uncharacterized protein LOC101863297 [Aplysia californica]|uniref:Uncharacterized protein LOC101863297 n=1 Tax=Aplysia californica TaxID=6500 RepID=A0ABM1W0W0_APLCA|nr:uncharacterized protein LOC101863297 [Aplysia californica]XP_035828303.1 uncharacterized protein LOC101863297 [Aplysia californica]